MQRRKPSPAGRSTPLPDHAPARAFAFRLSCGNDSFPLLPHTVALGLIAELGFVGHDLTLIPDSRASVPLGDVRSDIIGWARRIDERVRSRGLELSDIAVWADIAEMAPNHPDPLQRERGRALFHDVLEFAALLRAPGLSMRSGIDWPGESHEASLARAGEELARRATTARERGVRFSIEPHVGSVCAAPNDVERLLEVAPDLELTLDYPHFVSLGFDEQEVDPLLARTRHLHVRGGAAGRLQTRLDENAIDYRRIIDLLRGRGYDGYLSVEYVCIDSTGLNELDVVSQTVLTRDWLQKLVRENRPQADWLGNSPTA